MDKGPGPRHTEGKDEMGIKGIRKEVWKGLCAIVLAIFVIAMLAGPVAEAYSGRINTALGISTTQAVSGGE